MDYPALHLASTGERLNEKCEIVLVFLKPGVFGELHKIHTPTATITTSSTSETTTLPPVIPQNAEQKMQDIATTLSTSSVITGGVTQTTHVSPGSTEISNAVPGCANSNADNLLEHFAVPVPCTHTETMDTSALVLPKIDIFMTQHCSIPLIHCDYESTLKAVDIHRKENSTEVDERNDTLPSDHDKTEQSEETKQEVHTSGRSCTVIDYKKFLEDYADASPSPPKKKLKVDLKRKLSKQQIAANKYKSKFVTKPTHLPKLVCCKDTKQKTTTYTNLPSSMSNPTQKETLSKTMLTPAISNETREVIEVLLMLGDMPVMEKTQLPDDDNAVLVPIVGNDSDPVNFAPINLDMPIGESLEKPAEEQPDC